MSPGSRAENLSPEPLRISSRKAALLLRAGLLRAIRGFFDSRDFLEVETPILIGAPAPELHIDPIEAEGGYLQTSPELCMKRLLAAGLEKIYQISKCFRKGERGNLHLPEFTMLEWYHSGIGYRELMQECKELFKFLSGNCGPGGKIRFRNHEIDLEGPWEYLRVEEAFERWAPIPLARALKDDDFDIIMVEHIEPRLGWTVPSFIYDYPISLGSLARSVPDDGRFAERFEFYIGGLELANGFSELCDPVEQRARFRKDIAGRLALGKSTAPMPERFLESLGSMPEAAGIALGVDRLVMVMGGFSEIDSVVTFTPEETSD
jgi:lysyl-tRNA synthetase class 2